jgi:hypothetical protein
LEHLSLKKNRIHSIPHLSISANLKQLHFEGFDDDESPFVIQDNVFRDMNSLEELTLVTLRLGNLVGALTNLS